MEQQTSLSKKTRTVLITGGASGLGLALAREFLLCEDQVVIVDRDRRALLRATEECKGLAPESRILSITCDITSLKGCQRAVQKSCQRFGGIDVLINNAGISHRSLFAQSEPRLLKKVMDVNYLGSVQMTPCLSASP